MSSRRGERVRERWRQFGLPLPIADKVIPFRPPRASGPTHAPVGDKTAGRPSEMNGTLVQAAEAWERLAVAEATSRPPRELD